MLAKFAIETIASQYCQPLKIRNGIILPQPSFIKENIV